MATGVEAEDRPMIAPPGYRFRPSDKEVVVYFLTNKILGKDLPCDVIPTTDVFACSPDQLPLSEFKEGVPHEWFFFSSRSKADDDIVLTKDGYYRAHPDGEDEIYDDDKVVGYMKTLFFRRGKPPHGRETEWVVEEFRVNPQSIETSKDHRSVQEKVSNLVVCKISQVQPDSD